MFNRKTSTAEMIAFGLLLAFFFSMSNRSEDHEEEFGYGWIAVFAWVFAIVGLVYWKYHA